MSFWSRLGVVLGSLLDPLGRPNRAKIGPRGPQVRPKRPQDRSKTGQDEHFYAKSDFSKSIEKPQEKQRFCTSRTPRNHPKMASSSAKMAQRSLQDGSKTSPRRSSRASFCIVFFVFDFGPFWLQLGLHLPPPGAPKTTPKSTQKTSVNHSATRWPPRSLKDGPRSPTGRPKTPRTPPRTPPPDPLLDPPDPPPHPSRVPLDRTLR